MYKLSSRLTPREKEQESVHRPLLNGFLTTYNLWFALSTDMQEYLVLENAWSDLEPETRIIAHSPSLEAALSFASGGYSPSFSTAIERRRIIRGPMTTSSLHTERKIPSDAYVISFPPFDVIFCGRQKKVV